jgi:integrase
MGSKTRRQFGYVRRLPSKKWHASYVGPDLARHNAPKTYTAKIDAEGWLRDELRLIESDAWTPPAGRRAALEAGRPPTLEAFAAGWLNSKTLRPRTRAHYRSLLDKQILPTLGRLRLDQITPTVVREWHTRLGGNAPVLRSHAYTLLRSILGTAVSEQIIPFNPCVLRGAGSSQTSHKSRPATLAELAVIVDHMPDRLRLAVLLSAWCALRFGEVSELRRSDLDLKEGVIHVRRGVTRVDGKVLVGPPKSAAGTRNVALPPHLVGEVKRHLEQHVAWGRDALLFAGADGRQLHPSSLYRSFYPAREAAGRPDLRWHDLRHTGAVLAAATGASLAELMARLGHSTVSAAMRYQHAAADRDKVIAAALSDLAAAAAVSEIRHDHNMPQIGATDGQA